MFELAFTIQANGLTILERQSAQINANLNQDDRDSELTPYKSQEFTAEARQRRNRNHNHPQPLES